MHLKDTLTAKNSDVFSFHIGVPPGGTFYTSQVKCVNQLEENVYLLTLQKNFKSRVVGQNSQTPQGDRNLLTSLGNSDWNFRLARDEAVHLETAENLPPSRCGANNFYHTFSSLTLF